MNRSIAYYTYVAVVSCTKRAALSHSLSFFSLTRHSLLALRPSRVIRERGRVVRLIPRLRRTIIVRPIATVALVPRLSLSLVPERNRDLPTPDAREQRGISGDLARFTLPVHARRRRRALKSVNADYDIVRVELKNPSVCLEQWSREVDLFLSILGCTMNRLGFVNLSICCFISDSMG